MRELMGFTHASMQQTSAAILIAVATTGDAVKCSQRSYYVQTPCWVPRTHGWNRWVSSLMEFAV